MQLTHGRTDNEKVRGVVKIWGIQTTLKGKKEEAERYLMGNQNTFWQIDFQENKQEMKKACDTVLSIKIWVALLSPSGP